MLLACPDKPDIDFRYGSVIQFDVTVVTTHS